MEDPVPPPPGPRLTRARPFARVRPPLRPRTDRSRFEEIVRAALDRLPEQIAQHMDNVAVVVEEHADPDHLREIGLPPHQELLGLYEGVNKVARAAGGYNLVAPDRITLYRRAILREAGMGGRRAVERQVWRTLVHEIAHHFGYSDAQLGAMEREAYGSR